MHQTSTKWWACSRDLICESEDAAMEDLPEDVSTDGDRATLRSPPIMKQGTPKEDSLVRMEERK